MTVKDVYEKVFKFRFPFPKTISDWLIRLTEWTNQVSLHLAEVWPLAEIHPIVMMQS